MKRMETAQIRFLREVAGYRMTDDKRKEGIREEQGIADINTIIKNSQYTSKSLEQLESMYETEPPKLHC
jgi:hypothetical protein